ncbi:glycoside hydrolase family 47 protein [Zalerion maritima]|uniref:Glycoside hydrolase family 47 protein n=1 Tax=Zalerion maritima TaxID=339359 RepID=A0AAD5WT58_9PEZI|nr:glycoside hydrolase family 47 protein [Zalerion maritima]
MHLYHPHNSAPYKERWTAAAESSIRYLTSNPSLTFPTAYNRKELRFQSQHLACFGSCHYSSLSTYTGTATGIGPEMFAWQVARHPPPSTSALLSETVSSTSSNHTSIGITSSSSSSSSGSSNRTAEPTTWVPPNGAIIGLGVGGISYNQRYVLGGGFFWFAEVLKYLLFTFADDPEAQVQAGHLSNKWGFNTEGHLIKIRTPT